MGFTKYGEIVHRSKNSWCMSCKKYIKDYTCWKYDYIDIRTWGGFLFCDDYDSSLPQGEIIDFKSWDWDIPIHLEFKVK